MSPAGQYRQVLSVLQFDAVGRLTNWNCDNEVAGGKSVCKAELES